VLCSENSLLQINSDEFKKLPPWVRHPSSFVPQLPFPFSYEFPSLLCHTSSSTLAFHGSVFWLAISCPSYSFGTRTKQHSVIETTGLVKHSLVSRQLSFSIHFETLSSGVRQHPHLHGFVAPVAHTILRDAPAACQHFLVIVDFWSLNLKKKYELRQSEKKSECKLETYLVYSLFISNPSRGRATGSKRGGEHLLWACPNSTPGWSHM